MAKPLDLFVHRLRILLDPARHSADSDGLLLARWLNSHDDRAFSALVCRHGALVWRVCRGIFRRSEDAEETFQATFLILARKATGLKRHPSLTGWLYQTAYHLALKARTAAARRLYHEGQAGARPVADPLEEISVREARTILDEELNRLSASYREAILLCLYEGATQDEAAKRLGCSLSTLKRRLEKGRTILSRRLTKRGLTPESALALTLCTQAHVPAQLMHLTITTAGKFAAGETIASGAALVAENVLRTILVKKIAGMVTVIATLGGLTWAGGYVLAPRGNQVAMTKSSRSEAAAIVKAKENDAEVVIPEDGPRLDVNGDPLPPGAINRIGSDRLRHSGRVVELAYAPDGKSLASISVDGFLYHWNAESGKLHWRVSIGKSDYYYGNGLAFSANGKKLALLHDKEFCLVAADTGTVLVRQQLAKSNRNQCCAIAPDLTAYAIGFSDATVHLYDAGTGQEKMSLAVGENKEGNVPRALSFSANAKSLCVVARSQYEAPDLKPEVKIFNTKTGKVEQSLDFGLESTSPSRLVLSPKHNFLAVFEQDRVSLSDLKSKQSRPLLSYTNGMLNVFGLAAFSPDESLLAVGSYRTENEIVLFETASGKERFHLTGQPWALLFDPTGKTLAVADWAGCIALWDTGAGKITLPTPEPRNLGAIRFAGDGKQILALGDGVSWWDAAGAKSIRRQASKSDWHYNYLPAVSPDGKLMAVYATDGKLMIIDSLTGEQIRTLSQSENKRVSVPVTFTSDLSDKSKRVKAVFSPDGSKIVFLTEFDFVRTPGHVVKIWEVATGKLLHEFDSVLDSVDTFAISPNGRWLAMAGPMRQGNFGTGFGGKGGGFGTTKSTKKANTDKLIRLWDLTTSKIVTDLHLGDATVTSLVFSADSSRLVSVGSSLLLPKNSGAALAGMTRLWDLDTWKEIRSFIGHDKRVLSVAMTPDGRMLATGGGDKTLRLWEVATGLERSRIVGHEAPVFSLDFSPDGKTLAAASMDAPVYLWEAYGLEKTKPADTKLSKEDRAKLWQKLADVDAAAAFPAMRELIANPAEAVALLEEAWQQSPRATPKQMKLWLDDLYSDDAAARKTAQEELERYAGGHEDLLRAELKQTGALAMRQQLEKLLNRPDPQYLRRLRMLEILEQIRTAPVRRFLQALADQKEDALLAREASAGLKRLEGQK